MRQAIVTKYLGPTDYRSARVKATAQAGTVFVLWDDALDVDGNHERAARALAKRFGWKGVLQGGGMPDGKGNCYVFTEPGSPRVATTLQAWQTWRMGQCEDPNTLSRAERELMAIDPEDC